MLASKAGVIEHPDLSSASTAVRTSNLSLTVQAARTGKLDILKDVSFVVQEGEFVSLVGPSGCGKSTLLNILSSLITHSSGEVDIGLAEGGRKARIGYMFQTDALLPWRTVIANVELGLEIEGHSAQSRRDACREILAQLGLTGFENHYPSELSGGMRQRVSLARTWVTDPDIILMDEPFGALDGQTKLVIQEAFLKFWETKRKTVVFVTHDLMEAVCLSDRVLVFSSRPGHIKSEHPIDLPRPRILERAHTNHRAGELWQKLWDDLKDDVKASI